MNSSRLDPLYLFWSIAQARKNIARALQHADKCANEQQKAILLMWRALETRKKGRRLRDMTARTEQLNYTRLRQNEENGEAQSKVLMAAIQKAMRGVLLRPEELCRTCHKEPIAFAAGGGLCAYCADVVLE